MRRSCKIFLRLTRWFVKCNKITVCWSNEKQCILLKDGHQWLLRKESFYSKYKYHRPFRWMGYQSVSKSILRFPSFQHQHWNQDVSLTSRLYQIYVHSHKLLRETTLQNYVHIYCWSYNDILKDSAQRCV